MNAPPKPTGDLFLVKKGRLTRRLRQAGSGLEVVGTRGPELDREQREERVRRVLAQRSLEMFLQPIMDLKSGRSVGVEALSRFRVEPVRPPDVWFSEAASVGLGIDLEMLAVGKALEILPRLPSGLYLSINASVDTIMSERFRQVLSGEATDRIVLEITEHTRVSDYATFRQRIQELRSMGLRLAVDDAGAGYASFRHVLNLRPDVIKLDIGLTRGIDSDPARRALGSALLTFGLDAYNASMVAEGIETAAELDTLRDLGCPLGQGFYLGRPGRLRTETPAIAQPGPLPLPHPSEEPPDGRSPEVPRAPETPAPVEGQVIRLEIPAPPAGTAVEEDLSVPERHREDYAQLLALAAEIRELQKAADGREALAR
ncbi:MAG TPA: EAL domain-containing protein [Acidimicrobiales bacterium]|nr:EAL domain-containing protein [Acidimicrobiales bacterium]